MSNRILVCGGRDYTNYAAIREALDSLHSRHGVGEVIHGGAYGADRLGGAWAEANGIPVRVFPADWEKHGRSAGHIRNRQMLFKGLPHLVVAFPGGRGTANMIENARKEGVKVWQPKGTRESPDCSSEDSASRKLP